MTDLNLQSLSAEMAQKKTFEYLACPYSHPEPTMREARFEKVNQVAAHLMKEGRIIFSPISHTHPIAQCGLPKEWEFWRKYDRRFISLCEKVIVLMLPGWEESIGVQSEIRIAKSLGKAIEYMEPG